MVPALVILAMVVVIGAAWWFNPHAVIKRKLKTTSVTAIARVQEGEIARVVGTVDPGETMLKSPFGGRPCAWYRATVEEYHSHGKSGSWRKIIHDEEGCDFVLRDLSGSARVRMVGAEVASLPDQRSRSGTFDDATPVEEAFLSRHGRGSTGLLGMNRRLRYHEAAVEIGERVTVMGRARWQQVSGRRTLVIDRHPQVGLLVSDDPGVAESA